MSDQTIKVNYPALESMARQCENVHQRLLALQALTKTWQGQMQNGALTGAPGEAFAGALGVLAAKTQKMAEAFKQESDDIKGAINDMKAADSRAGANF
jgi:uncharacterized protein YukE